MAYGTYNELVTGVYQPTFTSQRGISQRIFFGLDPTPTSNLIEDPICTADLASL